MRYPLTIGVGAEKSGAGKTTFVEKLIKHLKNKNYNIQIIAIKYSKNTLYSSIVQEQHYALKENKDTTRMKKAGADIVYFVKAIEEDLPEVAKSLQNEITKHSQDDKEGSIAVIEGNSLVRVMKPDVIIFLKGLASECMKPSAEAILEIADLVIEGEYLMEEVMTEIEKVQIRKLIEENLREKSKDGKITCSEARKIAEQLSVPYIEVGRLANELKIKIRKCELGCF
ncbi:MULTISPECIES: molybdopterin-guanine dinucleotide biosynthesis protein MobB [Thermodesulfovibrio]|jgi:LAO/AO transport system kinase|uniref:molybdopterin-guanine dinucleotide biosynthesis protein MobB n=1 Tax=Thermodesulfovibrio TaxID=28261 RepID=UPI00261F69D0|nr:molybdopterin-guanine dinucleotide biosynthesis protein MobB [Thermodesulfovibrio sp.]